MVCEMFHKQPAGASLIVVPHKMFGNHGQPGTAGRRANFFAEARVDRKRTLA